MKNSKYIDINAVNQVIGCIYTNPRILDNDKYCFSEKDFTTSVHKIIFGAIFNLFQHGVTEINLNAIEDYLAQRPKFGAEYKSAKGDEYILACAEKATSANFEYYYNRLKKMTLFRAFEELGLNMSDMYDPDNILEPKKLQKQEEWIDNTSLAEIANIISAKIDDIKSTVVDNTTGEIEDMGDGLDALFDRLKESPDIGYPLYGRYINTISRGARLGKLYLRSAATNVGKTRAMVADASYIGCSQMYDTSTQKWVSTGAAQSTMFICVEQSREEVQTMAIAFLAGVDESHILDNEYFVGEWERVLKARQLLKQSKLKFLSMPDFSLQDIENIIKRGIREYNIQYVFYDYLSTSMKILEEITQRSGGVKLREDQILYLIATRLKDICIEYGIFIMSSTQLNTDYRESDTPDQNLLRGSKAIADKIDLGLIMLDVTQKDRDALGPICKQLGVEMPNIKISIYKNRRGGYRSMYLWCNADKSICSYNPVFATDWGYRYIELTDLKIKVEDEVNIF